MMSIIALGLFVLLIIMIIGAMAVAFFLDRNKRG
jgi:hypothetical protein